MRRGRVNFTELWFGIEVYLFVVRIIGAVLGVISLVVLCILVNLFPDDGVGIILGFVGLVIVTVFCVVVYCLRKAFKRKPAYDPSTDMKTSRWRWDPETGGPVRDDRNEPFGYYPPVVERSPVTRIEPRFDWHR